MLKINSKAPKTLLDLIRTTAEEDLVVNAEILGFNQQGEMDAMKTYEKRKYLAQQVLKNPEQVLSHLSQEDLVCNKPGILIKSWPSLPKKVDWSISSYV